MAEVAAIIHGVQWALLVFSCLNCAGSNLVGGICRSAPTRTRICTGDVPVLWGPKLPPYTLLLNKRLSLLS
ncbi:hypothetical protein L0665_08895 [Methanogenium marinum]|uniref:Uncharacterized protein n=1 Tax=Methanogenium marinum TaxID=348610 RepID=A0A9Q4KW20_9EURY|nr:hypothetical protein [Methanogenium marinum]MDE4908721.1 hypothetical protein [Methanogenium marinum]